jgi:PTS system N-acetylglucosamine-specific IIC component
VKDVLFKKLNDCSLFLQNISRTLVIPMMVLPFIVLGDFLSAFLNIETTWRANTYYCIPILFSVCVAMGLAKKKTAYAGVSAILIFMVILFTSPSLTASSFLQVMLGIFVGICAATVQNKCDKIKPSSWLLYINGESFSVFLSLIVGLGLSVVVGMLVQYLDRMGLATWKFMFANRVVCAGIYGGLNRLLLLTGTHHLLNNFVCFQMGQYHGAFGETKRFLAGDPHAGYFTAGMFPVTMFGLPAAGLAIFLCLEKTERKKWAFAFFTTILTTAFTGVTELIEFMFAFISPFLYGLHVIFTSAACAVTSYLKIRMAYGYSAGFLDYLTFASKNINYGSVGIFYVGMILFAVYFVGFYASIKLLKLSVKPCLSRWNNQAPKNLNLRDSVKCVRTHELAKKYICALGGVENIKELFSCVTRLRLVVNDVKKVDKSAILKIGALGVSNIGSNYVQVIIGLGVSDLFEEMDKIMFCSKSNELERGNVGYGFDEVC